MNFREKIDQIVDWIDFNRDKLIKASLLFLAMIVLSILFILSSDKLNVSNEVNELAKIIENRKYAVAVEYYGNVEKEFSENKMNRFNSGLSNKMDKLVLNTADKYINNEISKEQYMGLINMLNTFKNVKVDLSKIIKQSQRVAQMYKEENLEYDIAMSYTNITQGLRGMANNLDQYKQEISVIYDSREVFKEANENYSEKMYYEAIKGYEKVIEEDETYYSLAQNSKQKCIDEMYNYYISKSKEENENGNYDIALKYIDYIKEYHEIDEEITSLEAEYETNLSIYTLTDKDIINIFSQKSGMDIEGIEVTFFQQMIDKEKYYYVEVYEYGNLLNEVLINAKTRDLYSYRGKNKDLNHEYGDGYFRVIEDGSIQFAISEGEANSIIRNKLDDDNIKYKSIDIEVKSKINRYLNEKSEIALNEMIEKNSDTYYYVLVNKGLFKKKEVYIVDIYNKEVFRPSENGIEKY